MIAQLGLLFVVLFCLTYSHISMGLFVLICLALSVLMFRVYHGHKHEHGAFLSIDYRAHQSRIGHWNTGLKIAFAVFCVFACIAAERMAVPIYLFTTMSLLTVRLGRTPLHYYISLLTVPTAFILLSCLTILVVFSREPFGVLSVSMGGWYLCISQEAQSAALLVLLRALGAVSCLYMLSLSTPIYRIIAALRTVRVPVVVIELMYLIYRYLFILLEVHQNMVHASAARLGYRNYSTSLKTIMNNALNLMFISLRQTSGMLAAMQARCYEGEIRFLHRTFPPSAMQIITTGIITGGMAIVWVLGQGQGGFS